VLVDSYIKWRIIDPNLYYISVGGDEARAKTRLNQTVNAGLREEFGKRTVHDVISGERDKIMDEMREKADADARKIGVQIVDVRLKRVELPNEVSEAVYRRMEAERKRVANELRSEGRPRQRRSVPMPTASARSSSPRPIAMPRRSRVRAMPRRRPSTPGLQSEPRVLCFLPQPRSLSRQLQEQERSCWSSNRVPNSSNT
jgi:regulator of protease activity HflC (stomatin/prohibitin superfamily)